MQRSRHIAIRVGSLALVLVVWQVTAAVLESRFLPGPFTVLGAMVDLGATGELFRHVGITLARVAVAFAIAMALGTAFGILMGRYRRLDAALDGLLILGLNIPALVVMILCYLWFGLNEVAAIVAVAANKVPIVVVNMREGARAVDRELLDVARVFRLSGRRTFLKVYLPQLYPYLMASARSGLALVWKIVLVVELIGRSDGVGFQLGVLFQFFDITGILAYSFAFIAVVLAIEWLAFVPTERRLAAWRS